MSDNKSSLRKSITYTNMFWLFMLGNVLGVLLEGVWTYVVHGHWETHVVTIWGPFCLLYGVGAVILYIGSVFVSEKNIVFKFVVLASIASGTELLAGVLLKHAMNMRAWDYTSHFMSFGGYVSLKMTLIWGTVGVVFACFAMPALPKFFSKLHSKRAQVLCAFLSVFMAVNMLATTFCMTRWVKRHNGIEPKTQIGKIIDIKYNDNVMSKRFCEWYFDE